MTNHGIINYIKREMVSIVEQYKLSDRYLMVYIYMVTVN